MKSKATMIVSCTAAVALTLCLTGCGSRPSNDEKPSGGEGSAHQAQSATKADDAIEPYIEVDGQTFSADEWDKKVSGNSLAAESYVGKQVTVVAPVLSVSTNGTFMYETASGDYDFYDYPIGSISLFLDLCGFKVDIPEQYKDVVANISSDHMNGDYVKVSGTITSCSSSMFDLINGPIDGIPNSGPITIEKLS